jgi:hypothetical protein
MTPSRFELCGKYFTNFMKYFTKNWTGFKKKIGRGGAYRAVGLFYPGRAGD